MHRLRSGLSQGAVSIAGDDEDFAVAERPAVRALLTEGNARQQLEGFVAFTVQINARIEPLYRILVSAAGTDRHAAALLTS